MRTMTANYVYSRKEFPLSRQWVTNGELIPVFISNVKNLWEWMAKVKVCREIARLALAPSVQEETV
jgi:hypothetical protein